MTNISLTWQTRHRVHAT